MRFALETAKPRAGSLSLRKPGRYRKPRVGPWGWLHPAIRPFRDRAQIGWSKQRSFDRAAVGTSCCRTESRALPKLVFPAGVLACLALANSPRSSFPRLHLQNWPAGTKAGAGGSYRQLSRAIATRSAQSPAPRLRCDRKPRMRWLLQRSEAGPFSAGKTGSCGTGRRRNASKR